MESRSEAEKSLPRSFADHFDQVSLEPEGQNRLRRRLPCEAKTKACSSSQDRSAMVNSCRKKKRIDRELVEDAPRTCHITHSRYDYGSAEIHRVPDSLGKERVMGKRTMSFGQLDASEPACTARTLTHCFARQQASASNYGYVFGTGLDYTH